MILQAILIEILLGILDYPFPPYVIGAMLAVFLNLPWYINISIIPKQYGHLAPLAVASIILGLIGGSAKMLIAPLFRNPFWKGYSYDGAGGSCLAVCLPH